MNANDVIDISSINLGDDVFAPTESSSSFKSSNFGSGIELLFNDKKEAKKTHSSGVDDLAMLEHELNDLVSDGPSILNTKDDFFSKNISFHPTDSHAEEKHYVKFQDAEPTPNDGIHIGAATAENSGEPQTWDGFAKFNNVPMNPDKAIPATPPMSKDDMLREKFKFLRKLEALEAKGVNLTKKYNMESPLAEMQGEYEMIMEEKQKQNSCKFQGNMLMAMINGIEFLNNRFDPFDIKLDGWSEQINDNLNDYDDVFAELFEKYKSRASMAPELKLLFQLGGSAMMVHMTNTMFKSAMPGVDDILRQNPDLMRQFQSAAVNSMGESSPGFAGFMGSMMNQNQDSSGPPPPLRTQGVDSYGSSRGGNNTAQTSSSGRTGYTDGINIREKISSSSPPSTPRSPRAEMRGPSDINEILSGLKTKTINIQEQQRENGSSTISISDLKELQGEGNIAKKSKRRPKSDRNTVSLDI